MDDDLKQLLETMRQESAAAHAETRRHVEATAEDLRQENTSAHAETRRHVEATAEDLRQENTSAHAETRRHFETLAEGLRHEVQIVAEGVASLTERIDRRDARFEQVTTDLDLRLTRLEAASTKR